MACLRLQRDLPLPRPAVYEVIADIGDYPAFMPGFAGVRLDGWEDGPDGPVLRVYQTVGAGGLTMTFLSRARFTPGERIDIVSHDRPFRTLRQTWRFADRPGGRVRVHLEADYEMADRLAGLVFDRVFPGLLRSGLAAVAHRAARRRAALRGADRPHDPVDAHPGAPATRGQQT
ncbi:hypothetical protein F1188_07160 [Roseospira marina]|uniref:Coenzyme Q-binding protein COQ10 START domain-containing protein n=1 Tax=Roseospira marina TaxID=140057 RepID=A0A5M6IE05_9PROT|nr:SRPBCC family protein [Roseospira marina]KAA5606197.1 hypothetical protein F1188_07160 [Roseospira marina]MBB4314342.1 coenzyme Q-binding protein COQ10 [Roseospira marina]MBB5087502.1 coenzyme Q-binding protein COQ10 [Roseospira marina]